MEQVNVSELHSRPWIPRGHPTIQKPRDGVLNARRVSGTRHKNRFVTPERPSADPIIRRILVPLDFSPGSAEALTLAAGLAHQCNASLTLLHVIDINAEPNPAEFAKPDQLMLGLWNQGLAQMKRIEQSLGRQLEVQTVVVEGLPCEQIVERSEGFDLVVLGQSRDKSMWRIFAKHTAQRVSSAAKCPVLVAASHS